MKKFFNIIDVSEGFYDIYIILYVYYNIDIDLDYIDIEY